MAGVDQFYIFTTGFKFEPQHRQAPTAGSLSKAPLTLSAEPIHSKVGEM